MTTRIEIATEAVLEALRLQGYSATQHEVVGSTYIADKHTSDVDVLVYAKGVDPNCASFPGWSYGGSGAAHTNDTFGSWKKFLPQYNLEVNLLLTGSEAYFMAWLKAADVCRFIHLRGIIVPAAVVHGIHEIIMDDADPEVEAKVRDY